MRILYIAWAMAPEPAFRRSRPMKSKPSPTSRENGTFVMAVVPPDHVGRAPPPEIVTRSTTHALRSLAAISLTT